MQSSSKSRLEDRVNRVRESLTPKLLNTTITTTDTLLSTSYENNYTDATIASMIAQEARYNRELSNLLGPRAYLLKHNESDKHSTDSANRVSRKVSDVNKIFLQNTIRSVESHNRREQIEGAWRQHGLLKQLDEGTLLQHSSGSSTGDSSAHFHSTVEAPDSSASQSTALISAQPILEDDQTDPLSMREMWAARKAAVFSKPKTNHHTNSSNYSSSTEDGQVKTIKRRRYSSDTDSSNSDNSCDNNSTSTIDSIKKKKLKKKQKKEKKLKKKKKSKKEKKHKSK